MITKRIILIIVNKHYFVSFAILFVFYFKNRIKEKFWQQYKKINIQKKISEFESLFGCLTKISKHISISNT